MPAARKIGMINGKPVYRVPVRIVCNNSQGHVEEWLDPPTVLTEVIARSAAGAANFVRDLMGDTPETEITAYGPKGGEVYRYVGWESSIMYQMIRHQQAPQQLSLSL